MIFLALAAFLVLAGVVYIVLALSGAAVAGSGGVMLGLGGACLVVGAGLWVWARRAGG